MVAVYNLNGEKISATELPEIFGIEVRPDLIKRAVIAAQSHRLQPYGPNWLSGKNTSAFSFGPGQGLSRIARVTGGSTRGRGALVPQTVGGRKAHPPVPERNLEKRINKKERLLAIASAIAATADKSLVESRGHVVKDAFDLPIVVSEDLEGLTKTKDVKNALTKLGLEGDLSRAKDKKVRSGKGTKRGRKYKKKKSVLLVVSKDDKIRKAAENINGVDVATAKGLGAEHLAPGAGPARLTVYTLSALKDLETRFKEVL